VTISINKITRSVRRRLKKILQKHQDGNYRRRANAILLFNKSNLRLKRWNSYFYETQFQYPWELLVNFTADGGFEADFLNREAVVPSSKLILLHPDVALTVADNGVDGNKLYPALTFQWIGFQRWSWKNGVAHHPWGLALTSTFSDIAGLDETGHGVSFLYDKYTLTVSEHGDESVISLNLNLSGWLNSNNKTAEWIRAKVDTQ